MNGVKEVTITLAGEEVGLRLDFNAMARIEEETGEPFFGGEEPKKAKAKKAGQSFSAKETRILVWACAAAYDEARGNEPTRTLKKVGALIGVKDIITVSRAIDELTVANLRVEEPLDVGASEEADPPVGPSAP